AGFGTDHQPVHGNVCWQQGMIADHLHTAAHAILGTCKSVTPRIQVNTGVAQHGKGAIFHPTLTSLVENLVSAEAGHTASMMPHYGHFGCVKLVYGDQHTAHDAAERMRHNRPGILDEFEISLVEIHGLRKQFDQAGIHAGEHD